MNRLSKLSFLFSAISFVCLILGRMVYGGWHPLLWIPLGFFMILLIFPLFKERAFFMEFFSMKTTKQGMSMGTMILLMIALLALVNVISVRKYKTWDFSATQANTLSPQSVQLVKQLDAPLKATFFYKRGQEGVEENRRAFRELVKRYQDQNEKVSLDFVEVNERPDLAQEYGVNKGSGVVFLDYKGRKNRIDKIDEQEITSALLKVTREKEKIVYFVTGHGEMDLDDSKEGNGGNALRLLVGNNRYQVKTLATTTTPKIPDDADMVVIVGPQQNFLEHEVTGLESYLQSGGSLLLALKSKKTVGLEKILQKLGIEAENNYIFNVIETGMGKGINQGATVAVTFSPESEITKVFGRGEAVVFRNPMSLKKTAAPEGVKLEDLVKAPENSMAFKELKIVGEGAVGIYTLGMSAKGRFPGAAGDKAKDFALVVYGDAEFLSNTLLYQNLNRDLFLNTLASLAKDESMISITPREPQITKMVLTDTRFSLFVWAFVIPLPLLLLAASVGLWTRRRFA